MNPNTEGRQELITMRYTNTYDHTQNAPWHWLCFTLAAVCFTTGWVLRGDPVAIRAFPAGGLLLFLLGMTFQQLTVADEGNQLLIRFGPLPLFRKRIWYDDIRDFEKGRIGLSEGWGIQMSWRGGWVWSIWGRDCVVIRSGRGTIKIGTDDADNLVNFLKDRTSGNWPSSD